MKKLIPSLICSTAAAVCLGTVSAYAGYITPRVPPPANVPAIPANAPASLPTVRTVTTAHDDGPGSLRQAIAVAAPGDVVKFALRCPAAITLTKTLVIDKDLTVLGPGPWELTVMRSYGPHTPKFRVFEIDSAAVTLAGMTIRNGTAFSGTNIHDNLGGGILNRGSLTVSNCVVTDNRAPTTDWGTHVADPNFRFSVGFGAGIFSDTGSRLALINSTISGNEASGAGGAVCNHYADAFVATGCTLSGNLAEVQGGGLNFQGLTGMLQNCTLSGNATRTNGPGSAYLLITFPGETAALTLTACTIAHNAGSTNGACTVAMLDTSACTNKLLSALFADNGGPNFFLDGNPVVISLGHNLDSDGTSGLVNGVNSDQVGTLASPIDPKISPLQNNGGPTWTVALLPGSPALGAGACSDALGAPLPVDQRGFPRPQVTGCDIGAFENQAPTLICPVAQTVPYCGPGGGAFVFLTARVADSDGDALTVIWSVNGVSRQTNNLPATHPPRPELVSFKAFYPQGTNIVGLVVSDGKAVPMGCSTSVIVRGTKGHRILPVSAPPNEM